MAIEISKKICPASKKQRPCIIKVKKGHPIGNGMRAKIQGCVRCKETETIHEKIEGMECPFSKNGKHQWEKSRNLDFKQFKRYQKIVDEEKCPNCNSVQIREYTRDIGYNPHRRRQS